jgi:hypothetical protein
VFKTQSISSNSFSSDVFGSVTITCGKLAIFSWCLIAVPVLIVLYYLFCRCAGACCCNLCDFLEEEDAKEKMMMAKVIFADAIINEINERNERNERESETLSLLPAAMRPSKRDSNLPQTIEMTSGAGHHHHHVPQFMSMRSSSDVSD